MMNAKERAQNYISGATSVNSGDLHIFAGFFKAGNFCEVAFFEGGTLANLLNDEQTCKELLSIEAEGALYKWKGPMIHRFHHHDEELFRLRFPKPWREFKIGKNGTRSDAQEKEILAAFIAASREDFVNVREEHLLNALLEVGETAEWKGGNHRKGETDLVFNLKNGRTVRIEVKAINGRVYHS